MLVRSTSLFRKNELPGKDVLLCPRKDLAIFKIFCDSFLSCTHGKIGFKDRARTAVVSMVTTLSSGAYTLVYLENSYDTWYAEAETIQARIYTQNPQTSSKFGGWKENGIVRYRKRENSLQALVLRRSIKNMLPLHIPKMVN